MDAMAMALHTVWHGSSFLEIALKNVNMGGDADTIGAIAGQISGAIYGITEEMLKLYSKMRDFEKGKYELFLKGYELLPVEFHNEEKFLDSNKYEFIR